MLVLSRKVGERIVVPESNLEIAVVAIKGRQVRLGVSTPGNVAVYREEVWRQINDRARRRRSGQTALESKPRLPALISLSE
jgi:carbon storage regulator